MLKHVTACLAFLVHMKNAVTFPAATERFERSADLRTDQYRMLWTVTQLNITIEIQVNTTGWIGWGISPNGAMVRSDVITAWVDDKTGQVLFQDRYATGRARPSVDSSQDWTAVSGRQTNGFTCVTFTREIMNNDKQDWNVEFDEVHIIFAWGDSEPRQGSNKITKHIHRGTKMVNLRENPVEPHLPPDAIKLQFTVKDYHVPSTRTTYVMKFFEIPPEILEKPHYVIKFGPVISPGNDNLMHHSMLCYCPEWVDSSSVGIPREYDDPTITAEQHMAKDACLVEVLYAWGIGGTGFSTPPDVGLLFGPPMVSKSRKVLMIEMHYDNPEQRSDLVDSGGLQVWLTPTPRLHTGGMFYSALLANPFAITVPPAVDILYNIATCAQECIEKGMTQSGVTEFNIFAIHQHAHLTAKSIRTRLYRNGKELPPILSEWNYDFNYQQTRRISPMVKIKKGDRIAVECGLTSTNRDFVTVGGLDTINEMCASFIYYYPVIPSFTGCFSQIGVANMLTNMGFTNVTFKPKGFVGEYYAQDNGNWFSYNEEVHNPAFWTKERVEILQESHRNTTPFIFCTAGTTSPRREVYTTIEKRPSGPTSPCFPNPCKNGGICTQSMKNIPEERHYKCTCRTDWTGSSCSQLKDNCQFNPCKNGGMCQRSTRSRSGYSCNCPIRYWGRFCQFTSNVWTVLRG